ncbi:MAG: hypothetical protein KatS3mg114_1401 [Planctomycetaceae bacterium]|nr:MAG: hypothetical protein KatS3mg114_1401 [Planctomycetaceae bacterium]
MQLVWLNIEQLQPAPYNPRHPLRPGMPAYEKLRRSLAEFDLVQPIVWNRRTGHVVSGHQRLEVLRQQGTTRVPCIVVDLSVTREKALNLALNNEALTSRWDDQRLLTLLQELQQTTEFDWTVTGFEATDLKQLLFEPQESAFADDPSSPETVCVILEIPSADWSRCKPDLEQWLRDHPQVDVHWRLPGTVSPVPPANQQTGRSTRPKASNTRIPRR